MMEISQGHIGLVLLLILQRLSLASSYKQFVIPGVTQAEQSTTYVHVGLDLYASKAVNGDFRTHASDCSHTKVEEPETVAWLWIDLVNITSVKSVKLWYRTDMPDTSRLKGFTFRVSNTTDEPLSEEQICYASPLDVFPPRITEHDCKRKTRYIWIHQLNRFLSRDPVPVLEVCEVQIFGCDVGNWGENCNETCEHCVNKNSCDVETGNCDEDGCKEPIYLAPGCRTACPHARYGEDCDLVCGYCACHRLEGHCTSGCDSGWKGEECNIPCESGKFGNNCAELCSGNCWNSEPCNHVNGSCSSCSNGWKGFMCNKSCDSGEYGKDCLKNCGGNCVNDETCDRFHGNCSSCAAGWKGSLCENSCDNGEYGKDCLGRCSGHCLNGETCDRFYGNCSSCAVGWKGVFCNVSCESGKFGNNCTELCSGNCWNGEPCNNVNGSCSSCSTGWKGSMCNKSCDSGEYGQDCLKNCSGNCLNAETCDRFSGNCSSCAGGWTGPMCNTPCAIGKFGKNCSESCSGNCWNGEPCDHVSGNCSSCSAGWKGSMCNNSCDSGEYGRDCTENCSGNCLNGESCDRFSGNCSSCSAGWKSPMCNISCDNGKYGKDCLENCSGNCLNGKTCDRFHGNCSSCSAGWKGRLCNISCDSGEYGKDCLKKCSGNCFNGTTCDRFNGQCSNCSDLWKGPLCNISVCLPGTYLISETECKSCHIGEFQDEVEQTSCKKCPTEKNTTESTGAASESYCIASCGDGTEFSRNTRACKDCPKDFYTNRSVSEFCIMCPTGYTTNGTKSSSCFKRQENISNTHVPPKEQTYSFRLKYRMSVNCSDEDAKKALLEQIRMKVISRLVELAKQYPSLCNKDNVSECFQSVKVNLKACKTTNRRKRSTDSFDLDLDIEIPATSPTVADSNEPTKVVRTESVLQEDIDTQKTEYSPQGAALLNSTYVGKNVTCGNGTIPSSNNENCDACKEGTYHDTSLDVCKKCPRNFYQNRTGQMSCEACPGPGNIYTLSEGSTSETQCVEIPAEEQSQAGLITVLVVAPVVTVVGLGASLHFIRRRWFSGGTN